MIRKIVFILVFSLIASDSFAQKIIEKEFEAATISAIEIASEAIFNIIISSEKVDKIKIRTSVEGENFENIVLGVKKDNGILTLNPEFSPYFEAKNDKLAAHKVLAIEMELIVPENLEISIKSSLASVNVTGKFLSIIAFLGVGNCVLNEFSGDAKIMTNQGFINVFAYKTVFGIAFSKKGSVINELKNKGKFTVEAESFEGDISLFLIE